MDKIIRRSLLRRNQLLKQSRRKDLKAQRAEWRDFNRESRALRDYVGKLVVNERKERREDWQLGPLAPNREAGGSKDTYGSVDALLSRTPRLPRRHLKGPQGRGEDAYGAEDKNIFPGGEWHGEGIEGNVALGDRVVVISGRPHLKGMVGTVRRIDRDGASVFIEGLNTAAFEVPNYHIESKQKTFISEMPVAMSDIRLVARMRDDETGDDRDCIIKYVQGRGPYQQRETGSSLPRHTRYISGTDIVLEWPAEQKVGEHTTDCDTPRSEVEAQTYYASFVQLPMFEGVIDELRAKHSRDRFTHSDEELITKKIVEDARTSWLESRSSLMYPRAKQSQVKRRASSIEENEIISLVKRVQSVNLKHRL